MAPFGCKINTPTVWYPSALENEHFLFLFCGLTAISRQTKFLSVAQQLVSFLFFLRSFLSRWRRERFWLHFFPSVVITRISAVIGFWPILNTSYYVACIPFQFRTCYNGRWIVTFSSTIL